MALELGVNYKEFDCLIRQAFVDEVKVILEKKNKKPTDASISIASGLPRSCVKELQGKSNKGQKNWISMPARVIAAWVAKGLGDTINYSSKNGKMDFVSLSESVTAEKSPRTILNELVRLGQVQFIDDQVTLTLFEHTSNENNYEALLNDFTDNLAWHTLAGSHLLMNDPKPALLEQAVKVDGIFEESAQDLSRLGKEYWKDISKKMIDKATPISEKEEKEGGKHQLTFGVYCYYD